MDTCEVLNSDWPKQVVGIPPESKYNKHTKTHGNGFVTKQKPVPHKNKGT